MRFIVGKENKHNLFYSILFYSILLTVVDQACFDRLVCGGGCLKAFRDPGAGSRKWDKHCNIVNKDFIFQLNVQIDAIVLKNETVKLSIVRATGSLNFWRKKTKVRQSYNSGQTFC
jgi:hypothetical protein